MGIAVHAALNYARKSPTVAGFLRYTTAFEVPQNKSPEVLNLVNVVGIQMYLFVISIYIYIYIYNFTYVSASFSWIYFF